MQKTVLAAQAKEASGLTSMSDGRGVKNYYTS
jgi:hypothetical protein